MRPRRQRTAASTGRSGSAPHGKGSSRPSCCRPKGRCRLPGAVRRLVALIGRERAALVHSNAGAVLGGAIAARRAGAPHLWHLQESFCKYPRRWQFHADHSPVEGCEQVAAPGIARQVTFTGFFDAVRPVPFGMIP